MSCTISKISIFGNDGTQRDVDFETGLNIITGHSKKGKSALIEIVDYCLCASIPSIPKGIISEYAKLYSLILKLGETFLIIGRPAWNKAGSKSIYVEYENCEFDIDSITVDYFAEKTLHKIKGAGQDIIERHLGLNVTNTQLPGSTGNPRKASLRNMTPFLFQYQNLIASKHALFSKLEDYYKRKDIIDQVPIFLGIVDDAYYPLRRQIDELEQKLKKIALEKEKDRLFYDEYQRKLEGYYRNYFSVVSVPYPGYNNLQELIGLKNNLPELDDGEFLKTDSIRRYNKLKEVQSKLSFNLDEVNSLISDITQTKDYAKKIAASLNVEKDKNSDILVDEVACPLCGTEVVELEVEAYEIKSALESLNTELSSMVSFARYDFEQLEILKAKKRKLQQSIRENEAELNVLQGYKTILKEYKNKRYSIEYLKARIEVMAEQVSRKVKVSEYGDAEIRKELSELMNEIHSYDFDSDIRAAEDSLSSWMSAICNNLDFEEEFMPANVSMNLQDLVAYHNDKKHGRVSLSDMGSGANWLAIHLSASLGMLRLFAQSDSSVVPSFLFLDQPSQVYFPDQFNKENEDKKNVENIYITIIKELEAIKEESGVEPQVIVLDHASDLNLGKYNFGTYVRRDWHVKGKALI